MNPAGAGRWLKGVADRRIRAFADQHTVRTVNALGVEARFKCVTPHELGRFLTLGGEPLILQALQRMRSGECFYDIGANIGLYTILAAKLVGARGTVVAFEPEAGNFARLQANARLNRLRQVIACPLALSNEAAAARFRLHSDMVGEGGHGMAADGEGDLTVFCLPLDRLVELYGLALPNHIKIDVEGHEERVLTGMPRVLASSTLRTIVLEAHYYDQLAERRVYYSDAQLASKRTRLLAHMAPHRFRLAGEEVIVEGDVRFAHFVFTRD